MHRPFHVVQLFVRNDLTLSGSPLPAAASSPWLPPATDSTTSTAAWGTRRPSASTTSTVTYDR
eukprot:CAMPEP_0205918850 /NCGR_PEP_ID=MMETSP1325-20131115/10059_1 /ASSEMBLY_ACC=CAM_ASM_000708 /TAXON_ID=236786 /ORGANISM="Florenciella sp., Strain RCC1007" /LENGTH=62 /DNA_ID=CAMNT_0053286413 /DNA_START=24 /DNA_END=209 /DNA_ORIENTATION=-